MYIFGTCSFTGANATETKPGAPGIELPSNSTLYIHGDGKLTVQGGDASNGQNGSYGRDGLLGKSGEDLSEGRGRSGGSGGNGAGAGIGTKGGFGGGLWQMSGATWFSGQSPPGNCGKVYILTTQTPSISGGSGAYGGWGGYGGDGKSEDKSNNRNAYAESGSGGAALAEGDNLSTYKYGASGGSSGSDGSSPSNIYISNGKTYTANSGSGGRRGTSASGGSGGSGGSATVNGSGDHDKKPGKSGSQGYSSGGEAETITPNASCLNNYNGTTIYDLEPAQVKLTATSLEWKKNENSTSENPMPPIFTASLTKSYGSDGSENNNLIYTWYRVSSSGAETQVQSSNSNQYTIQDADMNYKIRIKVTWSISVISSNHLNSDNLVVTTDQMVKICGESFAEHAKVEILGDPEVRKTITAAVTRTSTNTFVNEGKKTYKWYKIDLDKDENSETEAGNLVKKIDQTTSMTDTYELKPEDIGCTFKVEVTNEKFINSIENKVYCDTITLTTGAIGDYKAKPLILTMDTLKKL